MKWYSKPFKSFRREIYLLKRECAVRSTPLMMWKSPLLKRVTISVRRSGHFWGKSSRPMMLIASLNCENRLGTWMRGDSFCAFKLAPSGLMARYLFLNLFRAAQHQIYNVCFNCCSVSIRDFVGFIFNLWENKPQNEASKCTPAHR